MRLDNNLCESIPCKPNGLGKHASQCWDIVVNTLPRNMQSRLDFVGLMLLCDHVELYFSLRSKMLSDPIDKEIRISFTTVVDKLDKLGRQFGWSPLSRASLTITEDKDDDPLLDFMKKRMEVNQN